MQIEREKHGNRDTGLNMVCTQLRLLWLPGAQVHVQLPIKVWFCFPRRQENVAFCLKCLEGCNFHSD